ncbi:MAG TPA: hypothetical protein VM580_21265 [Labilithrix sp.]|nr:hypothetical protein [Labilithrix sp.]
MSDALTLPRVPAVRPDDVEDVSWALSTAEATWSRGELDEGIKWVRRAAEAASEAEQDARALELAKAAADLAGLMAQRTTLPSVDLEEVSSFSTLAALPSLPLPGPPPPPAPVRKAASKAPPAPAGKGGRTVPPPPKRPSQAPGTKAKTLSKQSERPPSIRPATTKKSARNSGAEDEAGRAGATRATEAPPEGSAPNKKHADAPHARTTAATVVPRRAVDTTLASHVNDFVVPPREALDDSGSTAAETPAGDNSGRPANGGAVPVAQEARRFKATMQSFSPPRADEGEGAKGVGDRRTGWKAQAPAEELPSASVASSPPTTVAGALPVGPTPPTSPSGGRGRAGAEHEPAIQTSQAVRVVVWRDANGVHVAPSGTVVSAITVDAILVALEPNADLTAWLSAPDARNGAEDKSPR